MSWIRFVVFANNYRGRQEKYTYAIPQEAVKCMVVNPNNEIVFDVGTEGMSYSTEKFKDYLQATLIFNAILNDWGKDIFVPRPQAVEKYLEEHSDGKYKDSESK